MRKLIVSLSLLGLAACNESSTSPDVTVAPKQAAIFVAPESPPPPPLDSGAYGSTTDYGSSLARINTTYFLNKPGTSGWLTFQKNQAPGTVVDKTARISYSGGEFSGKGTLTFAVSAGSVTLDLSSVAQTSHFGNSEKGYFTLSFTKGYFTSPSGAKTSLTGGSSLGLSEPVRCSFVAACDTGM